MFRSIYDDVKSTFSYGHMITRLIIINLVIFIFLALFKAFSSNVNGWFSIIIDWVALPSSPISLLYKPWTLITHLFTHYQFGHILWNMIGLHMFGVIMGDLLGDRKVLPIYILGGISGGLAFMLAAALFSNVGAGSLVGASGAVSAIALISAIVAPDYNVRLILIGNVKLKFIVLFFLLFDIIMSQGYNNAGGHYAHLGGMLFGALYVILLRKGRDIGAPLATLFEWISSLSDNRGNYDVPQYSQPRSKLRVEHRSDKLQSSAVNPSKSVLNEEDRIDKILEKIKREGYDMLTSEEKDFLNRASKR